MKRLLSLWSLLMLCIAGMTAQNTLIDYPTSKDGTSISGTTTETTVKIHLNKDAVACYSLKNGYTGDGAMNGNHIKLIAEGGFKAGDVVTIAGAINNSDETKHATAVLFSSDDEVTPKKIFQFDDFINSRLVADDPVPQSYTLEEDYGTLYLGRDGGTAANITLIKVERPGSSSDVMPAEVTIDMSAAITDGTAYYCTFSCPYPLDFSQIQGLKAYTGKKHILYDSNSGIDASEVIMTNIEKVPAGTGIVLKASSASSFTVPTFEGTADPVANNDLLVATEKTDIYPLTDDRNKAIATLDFKVEEQYDWWTGQSVNINLLGFFRVNVPAEPGVDFLEQGDVYISLTKDEIDQTGWYYKCATLTFTDTELPIAETIAALVANGDGDATLKLQGAQVTHTNGKTLVLEDATGGIVLQGIEHSLKTGDIVAGEITGTFNGSLLMPTIGPNAQTDASKMQTIMNLPVEPSVVDLSDAFTEEYLMHLVKLTDITANVTEDTYGKTIRLTDKWDTEVNVSAFFSGFDTQLGTIEDGDQFEEITGYALILPQNSMYVLLGYDSYNFEPISFKRKEAAPTAVSIDMTAAIADGDNYVRTFSSQYDLDFSAAEGIKAYVATKGYDSYGALESVVLKAVEQVPAGTGILLKAEAAQQYSVPLAAAIETEVPANVFAVADADLDLNEVVKSDRWGDFLSGPSILMHANVAVGIDWDTFEYIYEERTGFLPAKPGVDEVKAGDVYLPIEEGEWDANGNGYVKLLFTDMAVEEYSSIAELTSLPLNTSTDGTPATLNMAQTTTVSWTNGRYMAIQDATGGIFMENPGLQNLKAGDVLTGKFTGVYENVLYPFLFVSPITDGSSVTNTPGTAPDALSVGLVEAFESECLMRFVKLTELKLRVVKGYYSNDYYIYDADGNEVYLNDAFGLVSEEMSSYSDGTEIAEVTGFAFIIPEGSPYIDFGYDRYQFLPISILKKTATGIDAIDVNAADAVVFNLQGVHVSSIQKGGLYIVNGKKVMVK